MTQEALIVCALLGVAMLLFIRGTWRHDVVAFATLMAATALGVVPSDTALSGFGHPAVFTVAAVLVISRALQVSGLLDPLAERLAEHSDRPVRQLLALTLLATILSAFMNNVGALALVMPIATATSLRSSRPPALLLMPLAFGSILGGMCSLIGTPPNLVVSGYRAAQLGVGYSMFDFTAVGVPVAALGMVWLVLGAPRILSSRPRHQATRTSLGFEVERYMSELRVAHGSSLIGRTLADLADPAERDLEILGLVRAGVPLYQSLYHLPLRPGDVVVLRARSGVFERLARTPGFEHVQHGHADADDPGKIDTEPPPTIESEDLGVLEVVVPVGSRMEGRTPRSLRLHTRMGINILAIGRRGRPFAVRLADVVLRGGDVLLLQGDVEKIAETAQTYGCLPLAERGLRMTRPRHRHLPLLLFLTAVALTATRLLPVHIAFGLAVVGLIVTQSFTIRQLYDTVDWSVIVLLAALIPIGEALEHTGATAVIANGFAAAGAAGGPLLAIVALLFGTTLLTNLINNAATAVVMAPIGYRLALQMDCSPDPFLMAVAVGASCAFATPIGHQNNVLVMGPGGYRFSDYLRVGLPLTALTLLVALPVLLWRWPLQGV